MPAASSKRRPGSGAGSLRHLGHLYEAYGYSTQGFAVWLATELEQVAVHRQVEEQDMRVCKVRRDEWEAMLHDGEVKDAPSIAAYGLLLLDDDSKMN